MNLRELFIFTGIAAAVGGLGGYGLNSWSKSEVKKEESPECFVDSSKDSITSDNNLVQVVDGNMDIVITRTIDNPPGIDNKLFENVVNKK